MFNTSTLNNLTTYLYQNSCFRGNKLARNGNVLNELG